MWSAEVLVAGLACLADLLADSRDALAVQGGRRERVIQRAVIHVQSSGREEVSGANVLVAIFAERESHAAYFLRKQGLDRLTLLRAITHPPAESRTTAAPEAETAARKPAR